MATEGAHVQDEPFEANADLSAKQFYPVKLATGTKVDACSAVTDRVIGVLRSKPKAGEVADVRIHGIAKVVSDGSGTAIAVGDYVGVNAAGKAVKVTTPDRPVFGIALEASSADGTIIAVQLTPGAFFRTAA